ncbi:hypothetical protein BS35_008234 [Actinomadura glauciflava]|uniref:hypothetical protein n=1 Tax=Actinomadura luteofluorescens TaxID=46163 RepID=UPI002164BE12|nr:hypothetical protein [Actinomadura glauciflava]MCR3745637.1 hypothetical protein [Actinomadura glauciflava]
MTPQTTKFEAIHSAIRAPAFGVQVRGRNLMRGAGGLRSDETEQPGDRGGGEALAVPSSSVLTAAAVPRPMTPGKYQTGSPPRTGLTPVR